MEFRRINLLKTLIAVGADVNGQDRFGSNNPVHIAAEPVDQINLLKTLVARRGRPLQRLLGLNTALYRLARIPGIGNGHGMLNQLLSSCGVDVRAEDIRGRTPLHLVAGTDGGDGGDQNPGRNRGLGPRHTLKLLEWRSFNNDTDEVTALLWS